MTTEPLDAQGKARSRRWRTREKFEEATVKTFINKTNTQRATGSSGSSYSHLQAALCDKLVEDPGAVETLVVFSRVLPPSVQDTAHEC